MKLQFRRQKFQADAAKAVVDVFAGQPYLAPMYTANPDCAQQRVIDQMDFSCWRNEPVVPELSDAVILEHLNKIQRTNQIEPSSRLEGRYNLTVDQCWPYTLHDGVLYYRVVLDYRPPRDN